MDASHSIFLFCIKTSILLGINLKQTLFYVIVFSLSLLIATSTHAGAGDLDKTFGNDGLVVTDVGGNYDDGSINKSVVLPDGKMLIFVAAGASAHIQRYNLDGTLDEAFGNEGDLIVATNSVYEYGAIASDFIIQDDGKIIVGGGKRTNISNINTYDFMLSRYMSDGSIDTSFGNDGEVTFGFDYLNPTDGTYEVLKKIAIQNDGSILVAGSYRIGKYSSDEYVIVRFNKDGEYDGSFGSDGYVDLERDMYVGDVKHLTVQDDNKILTVLTSSSYAELLMRINPEGIIDNTFGVDGVINPLPTGDAIALQNDGKIIIGGYATNYPEPVCGFGLYRYNLNGVLDPTFGVGGRVLTDFGCTNYPSIPRIGSNVKTIAIRSDNKIIAFGERQTRYEYPDYYYDLAIAQYDPDGTLDESFGLNGKVVKQFDSRISNAVSININTDEQFTLFSNLKTYPIHPEYYPHYNPVMLRYTSQGILDQDFSDNGIKTIPIYWSTDDDAKDVVITQGDGKIVVGGSTSRIYDNDFVLVRYSSNGSIDESFGIDGKVITDFTYDHPEITDDFRFSDDSIRAIKQQSDGKIIAIGHAVRRIVYTGDVRLAISRYLSNGDIDISFGINGKVILDLSNLGAGRYNDLALQDDGKIVVVGSIYSSGVGSSYTLIRFNSNGTIDVSFGENGVVKYDPFNQPGFDYQNELHAVEIQPDGKIITAGGFFVSYPLNVDINRWNLLRFNPDGSLDESFYPEGGGGIVNALIGEGWRCYDLALQNDGKIIIAGTRQEHDIVNNILDRFTMIRYDQNGYIDMGFGDEGIVNTNFFQSNGEFIITENAKSIALQADGRILLAGEVTERHVVADDFTIYDDEFGVARYNNDGELDYSFGNGGKVVTDFGSTKDIAEAISVQSDGKILVVGSSSQNSLGLGNQIALARYEGVSTKFDELEGLVLRVQELNASGVLNQGQANSLQVKLQAAIQQADRNNYNTAVNQINAFINEVESSLASGKLTQYQGDLLMTEAHYIISLLN